MSYLKLTHANPNRESEELEETQEQLSAFLILELQSSIVLILLSVDISWEDMCEQSNQVKVMIFGKMS